MIASGIYVGLFQASVVKKWSQHAWWATNKFMNDSQFPETSAELNWSELKAFTDNHLGYVSNEQIERFYYQIQVMEEQDQRRWSINMMADTSGTSREIIQMIVISKNLRREYIFHLDRTVMIGISNCHCTKIKFSIKDFFSKYDQFRSKWIIFPVAHPHTLHKK